MTIGNRLKELIEALIDNPIGFSDDDLREMVSDPQFTNKHLKYIFRRIYDLNEGSILNKSGADLGLMGFLNKRSKSKRNRIFLKKIRKGFKFNPDNKVILAEGDSWFEYPLFINEIIDTLILNRKKDYAIYSLAFGGDWLSNMIYENTYIEELQLLDPDVFLISGGGNDLAGGMRIAQMVEIPERHPKYNLEFYACKYDRINYYKENSKVNFDSEKYEKGLAYLNKEFFGLLKAFKIQYTLLFENLKIKAKKFSKLKIITQGYDYPIPSFKLGFGLNPFKFHKPITNLLMGNGIWLKMPLQLKGIKDQDIQEAILYSMIFDFNEMMVSVTKNYENVYHIDCRGINTSKTWYNELHPESKIFKIIGRAYQDCIDGKFKENHIVVKNLKYDV